MTDLALPNESEPAETPSPQDESNASFHFQRNSSPPDLLPMPVTTSSKYANKKTTFLEPDRRSFDRHRDSRLREKEQVILAPEDEKFLFPAYMPPKYHLFDLFPFSLLVRTLTARGKEVKGKKAAKIRAQMRKNAVSHNLPHEISLYLVSLESY